MPTQTGLQFALTLRKRFGKQVKQAAVSGNRHPPYTESAGIPLNLAFAYKHLTPCHCLYFFLLLPCGCFNQHCFLQKPTPRGLPSPHEAATGPVSQGRGAIPIAVAAPQGAGLNLRPLSTPRGPSQPCSHGGVRCPHPPGH